MGKISTVGVPSTTLGTGSSDSAPQALCYPINLLGASLRMTFLWEIDEKLGVAAPRPLLAQNGSRVSNL
jgi:hypothetical protein